MNKELIEVKQKALDSIALTDESSGVECWSARELINPGYDQWRNFEKVINKALYFSVTARLILKTILPKSAKWLKSEMDF